MTAPDLMTAANEIAKDVGAPNNFFMDLLREDDWSFVIKTHALIEAGVGQLITGALGKSGLENFVSRLPINSERSGKLALLKDLELLQSRYRRYISALSILRNYYVHSVGNVATTIEEYICGLDEGHRKRFIRDIMLGAPDPLKIGNRKVALRVFIEDNPKVHIWISALDLLGHIHLEKQTHRIHTSYADLVEQFSDLPEDIQRKL